jgi:hypothetical protein
MSYDLCRETSRGVLTDLSATDQNIGIDAKIVSTNNAGKSILDQKLKAANNYVKDTSVRSPLEGQRNVFSGTIVEEGDMLSSATLVLMPIHPDTTDIKTETVKDCTEPCFNFIDMIKSVELRINGQCIQRLTQADFEVPFVGINDKPTEEQQGAYEDMIYMDEAPYYLPLNFFFAKKNNAYPLVESQYPLEIRVEFAGRPDAYFDGSSKKWEDTFQMTLLSTQVYLNDTERKSLQGPNASREYLLLQRDTVTHQVPDKDTTFRAKLESNMPMRVLRVTSDRIVGRTIARFLINGHIRFEHYAKRLALVHILDNHAVSRFERKFIEEDDDRTAPAGIRYHFGDACPEGPNGRLNLTQLDNPTIELMNLNKVATKGQTEVRVDVESYNILDWRNGKSFLRLHKSR